MGSRLWRAIEVVAGVLLGLGVAVGALVLLDTVVPLRELDVGFPLLVLAALGLAGPRLVSAGIAVVTSVRLHVRFRYHLRTHRLDILLPLGRDLLAEAERIFGVGHRITTARRHNLCSALSAQALALHRRGHHRLVGPLVAEASVLADCNLRHRQRELGTSHPDTVAAREVVEQLGRLSHPDSHP